MGKLNAEKLGLARGESLVGKSFGRWYVESELEPRGYIKVYSCRCECGTIKEVTRQTLIAGNSNSCGCLRTEQIIARSTSHNGSNHSLWGTYHSMLTRCRNPNYREYHLYGGRGITVCQSWQDNFQNFLDDMGEKPSQDHQLDRKDTNGNYNKENCRWVTKIENARNKRTTVFVDFRGEKKTLKEVAEILQVAYSALYYRYQKGETGENLFRPSQAKGN